jgi:hypothetical protein
MPRSGIIVFSLMAFVFVGYLGMRYFDMNAAFFRGERMFKAHYNSHKDEFAALAEQFEKTPPVGENSLCLAKSCSHSSGRSLSSRRREQVEFYPGIIQALGFTDGRFFRLTNVGEVVTIPISWTAQDYYVNATLHYTGGEPIDTAICDKPPTDGKGGRCAMPLSDTWIIRYAWMSQSVFAPPAGTAEAECESASNKSFAAYTECLKNSKAPPAKRACEFDESARDYDRERERFNKCLRDQLKKLQGL